MHVLISACMLSQCSSLATLVDHSLCAHIVIVGPDRKSAASAGCCIATLLTLPVHNDSPHSSYLAGPQGWPCTHVLLLQAAASLEHLIPLNTTGYGKVLWYKW